MTTVQLIALLIPISYLLFSILETLVPSHVWPAYPNWRIVGIGFFLMLGVLNNVVAFAATKILSDFHCLDIRHLGVVASALIAFFLLSMGNAALHFAYHRVNFLWRYVHQLHHAPARLDVAGVMFQTPLEGLANAMLFALVTSFLLEIEPVAAVICAFLAAIYGMFQHCNVKTPRWLGYFIQRPEAHCVHHQRGVHAWNYSDLPLWDMLFGTFKNPKSFCGELGFGLPAKLPIASLVLGKNVVETRHDHAPSDG